MFPLLPRMVMSTESSSRGCAVNTDTAATQMTRDSSRLQRALSTPANSITSDFHLLVPINPLSAFRNKHYLTLTDSPIISMKICFQCSQVWNPRFRAEDRGSEASCSWMKFSH